MSIKDKIKISFVKHFLHTIPEEATIIKVDNGYLYGNKYYTTIDGALAELFNDIKKYYK